MSTELPPIDLGTVTPQERTWRINIETALNTDPTVTIYREKIILNPDNSILSQTSANTSQRNLSAVADETQPFTPATEGVVTGAELAGLVAARADMWSVADAS